MAAGVQSSRNRRLSSANVKFGWRAGEYHQQRRQTCQLIRHFVKSQKREEIMAMVIHHNIGRVPRHPERSPEGAQSKERPSTDQQADDD
jgi:hypothetical protein